MASYQAEASYIEDSIPTNVDDKTTITLARTRMTRRSENSGDVCMNVLSIIKVNKIYRSSNGAKLRFRSQS